MSAAKKPEERRREPFFRELSIDSSIDAEARTVELSFSSDAPYKRYDWWENRYYEEVLSHEPEAVDLQRLAEIGVVLVNHDSRKLPVGAVEKAWLDGNKGRALVRFDDDADSDAVFRKVQKGIMRGVSVGYFVHEWQITEPTDGRLARETATKWEPLEISIVSVPADASVGVGRSIETEIDEGGINEMPEEKTLVVEEVKEIDVEAARADAVKADRARVSEIRALEKSFNMDLADHIEKGTAVEEVRKLVLEEMAKAQEETRVSSAIVTKDETDKFRAAAEDAILMRGGVDVEKPASGAEDMMGLTLKELMYETLRRRGESVRGRIDDVFSRAMNSTSDFPYVLGNVANKSVLNGWDEEPTTWQMWVDTGSVTSFHIHTAARTGEMDDLDQVREGDEYNYGAQGEQFEQYQVVTYGKLFAITRQAIINDDLDQLVKTPAKMGAAAKRKIDDVVYASLTGNPLMGDGKALFHSGHGNYIASGGSGNGAPGTDTIAAAVLAMKKQKDISGKARLNIQPKFLLAPVCMEAALEQFFGTTLIGGESNQPNLANIYAGNKFIRVYESRLDDALTTGWYMAAAKGKTITAYFLNGQKTPYLETKQGWNVDGVEYKVRIDVGAKAMDWRGLYFNYGA